MAYPGKAITHEGHKIPQIGTTHVNSQKYQYKNQKSSDKMKYSTGFVFMFSEIKTIEFTVSFNSFHGFFKIKIKIQKKLILYFIRYDA